MPKQTIEVDESLVPAGFRAAGFGKPRAGQWYEHCGVAHQAFNDFSTDKHLLLEKVEPVRESLYASVYHYAICGISETRTGCDAAAVLDHRQGVIRLDYEDNKLVAVSLQPLGEEPQ